MFHLFTGSEGIGVGLAVFAIMWALAWLRTKGESFEFDALGERGAFEKLLTTYLDVTKFAVGLASGSIVLLVGSSALRETKNLPSSFASPLFLLALSIIYGILFMAYLTISYEAYRHKTSPYTRFKYTRNLAFGFGGLFCFCVGYLWLIVIVTR